ncbi:MAG: AhpC/TSA family protein [Bacteroidetes bacterium]|nr:AhpC/TSA family protein [Bacteroidota bacterium]
MKHIKTTDKSRAVKEAKGLLIGDNVPIINGKDIFGKPYSLQKALENGPVILVFIRGQWCPFCNKHLSHLQKNLPLIYDKGASVVAISPEKSEFIKKSIDKTGAEFTILHDEGHAISDLFDLTFKPGSISRFMINKLLGAKLKESHSDLSERLPIPATFAIGKNGKITWRHFNPDFKKRSAIKDILEHLSNYE